MNWIRCKGEKDWVLQICALLTELYQNKKLNSLFLPAGETPKPLYDYWEATRPEFLKSTQLIQIDEIITGQKKNQFRQFFAEYLPSYKHQIQHIDRADQLADVALLGLGTNGHVAFHEPGLPANFYSGCLNLNAETVARLGTEPQTRVVTYGLEAFMRSYAVLLIVRGESKKSILDQVINKKINAPAAKLLEHKNLYILTDF